MSERIRGPMAQRADDGMGPGELEAATPYAEPRWYACYTRARHEKRVSALLGERGIEAYVPVIVRERQWKDRKKAVEFPLFPSYVFGRFTLRDMHRILTTPGVATIVRSRGRPTPVPDEELENVRRFERALEATGLEPPLRPLLAEGDRVRFVDGPFVGVVGQVTERRGRRRVLVGIASIGRGLEVDVGDHLLERLPRPG